MIDFDELPVPDLGLRCPHCDAPLAGLQEHRCADCGETFNLLHVLGAHRPVPDIGLTCPECGYLLTGLTGSRCPECGTKFSVREMLEDQSPSGAVYATQLADPHDHYAKKREPTFTGDERPLPDFGLSCAACDSPLAGADDDACLECGQPFDLFALVPNGAWVPVSKLAPSSVAGMTKAILHGAGIPYLVDNEVLSRLYGGSIPLVSGRIRVPRSFFFDALHAFAAAVEPSCPYAQEEWVCPACTEPVPAGFEVCWNCSAAHPDHPVDE